MSKPNWCPERHCVCLARLQGSVLYDSRKSIICIGQMYEPRTTNIDGAIHENDLYECHWTPRGWVKFEANADDLMENARINLLALKKLGMKVNPTYLGIEAKRRDSEEE